MVQATNDLILGIDLAPEYAQVTYWHQSVKEPVTLGNIDNTQQLPTGLRQDEHGNWSLWNGEPVADAEHDLFRVSGIWRRLVNGDPVGSPDAAAGQLEADELLAVYLKQCIAGLKLLTQNTRMQVMITVRQLTETLNNVIVNALLRMGVNRKQIYVQDYLSSFYYYTVNQKKELWNQDVALLTHEDDAIIGYVLHIDRKTKPALARVDRVARQEMGEEVRAGRSQEDWDKEKDRLFFELLKKVFERRNVTVSYLMGDYFSRSWAERSIQYLCFHRHAYQGMNLYSKGACYAALERAGLAAGQDIIFSGSDMIDRNLGMEMNIRGKETFYSLISAGVNWYEAHHVCEFILRKGREIRVISSPMAEGERVVHMMRLPGLPRRPDRATRLRMTVYYTSPVCCHIEVEDLGLGGLYKASGLSWSREIVSEARSGRNALHHN